MKYYIGQVTVTHGEYSTNCTFRFTTEEHPDKYLLKIAKSWYGSTPTRDGNGYYFDGACVYVEPAGWLDVNETIYLGVSMILNQLTP